MHLAIGDIEIGHKNAGGPSHFKGCPQHLFIRSEWISVQNEIILQSPQYFHSLL